MVLRGGGCESCHVVTIVIVVSMILVVIAIVLITFSIVIKHVHYVDHTLTLPQEASLDHRAGSISEVRCLVVYIT